jgi:hypothetical protein
MSTIAVIFALAGGATAVAVTVNASKKSDVNKKGNIRAGRVTAKKLANGNVVASKLTGIEVVQASVLDGVATASCPGSERLLGGGAKTPSSDHFLIDSSPSGNSWEAMSFGAGPGAHGVTAYALCLKG